MHELKRDWGKLLQDYSAKTFKNPPVPPDELDEVAEDIFNMWSEYDQTYQRLEMVVDREGSIYRRNPDIFSDVSEWNDHLMDQALSAGPGAELLFDTASTSTIRW